MKQSAARSVIQFLVAIALPLWLAILLVVVAFASYLLIASPDAYFAMQGSQQYGVLLDFPQFHLNIGAPLDTAHQQPNGTWVRHFQYVTVTVNPAMATAQIESIQ